MIPDTSRSSAAVAGLREADARRKRAINRGLLVGLVAFVATFLVFAMLKTMRPETTLLNLASLLSEAVMAAAPFSGYFVYRHMLVNKRILVWCRRFRPSYGRQFRFHRALATACSGIAYPITIQDSSYPASLMGSFSGRGWFLLPAAILVFYAGLIVVAMPSLTLLPEHLSKQGFGVGFIAISVAIPLLALKAYRRLGYRAYRGPDARRQVRAELEAINAGRRGGTMGVEVVQCDDAGWRDVVTEALSVADVAVIDVSDLSENLRWELDEAIAALTTARVIIVHDDGLEPPATMAEKSQITEAVTRAAFTYPAAQVGL